MLYNICVDIYIHLSGYNLKIIKFIIQAILDFLMKQQLITLMQIATKPNVLVLISQIFLLTSKDS